MKLYAKRKYNEKNPHDTMFVKVEILKFLVKEQNIKFIYDETLYCVYGNLTYKFEKKNILTIKTWCIYHFTKKANNHVE